MMQTQKKKASKHYTLEMQRPEDEFVLCYWTFDDLNEAQQHLQSLLTACTAYTVYLVLYDELQQFIEGYKLGDETTAAVKLKGVSEMR